jgi:hypothetical protein
MYTHRYTERELERDNMNVYDNTIITINMVRITLSRSNEEDSGIETSKQPTL